MGTELEDLSLIIGKAFLSTSLISREALGEIIPAALLAATNALEAGYSRAEPVRLEQAERNIEEVDVFDRFWVERLSARMSGQSLPKPELLRLKHEVSPTSTAPELWYDDDFSGKPSSEAPELSEPT